MYNKYRTLSDQNCMQSSSAPCQLQHNICSTSRACVSHASCLPSYKRVDTSIVAVWLALLNTPISPLITLYSSCKNGTSRVGNTGNVAFQDLVAGCLQRVSQLPKYSTFTIRRIDSFGFCNGMTASQPTYSPM